LLAKLWGSKVPGVPADEISGLPRGSPVGVPGEKNHLDVGPWRGPEYTIREKVVASPKFGPW